MRIRTQLILAAFVLAVVPLAAIVTWSYYSSREALESAYRREAERLTRQMDRRLTAIRADLDRKLTVVSALPLPADASREEVGDIVNVMGESASLVDALEFHPIPPSHPAAATMRHARAAGVTEVAGAAEAGEPVPEPEPAEEAPAAPAVAAVAPVAPVVIDIPAVTDATRFVMSEKQRELVSEITRISVELQKGKIAGEDRADMVEELQAAQEQLRTALAEDRARRRVEIRAARDAARAEEMELALTQARTGVHVRVGNNPPVVLAPPVPEPRPAGPSARATPRAAPESGKGVRTEAPSPRVVAETARKEQKTKLILGRKFAAPVRKEGEVVGQLTAQIRPEQVISRVLGGSPESDDSEEIPFAIDSEGTVYARNEEHRGQLDRLGVARRVGKGQSVRSVDGWLVTTTTDTQSGLRIGVARPVGESFDGLRRTAARNFAFGMGLIVFALIGIVPLSNHLSRDVKLVTEGAERIAHGDLMTRLPVKTNNEMGQLARAFNRMAADLSANQQQLLEQERARRDQEMSQRLLEHEYQRKSVELEEARRFQLSLLPKEVPHFAPYDIAVYTQTATEVGGDYYDFHNGGESLSIAIGDATGHGAKAGTMVTVVKTLFAGYDGRNSPAAFLGEAAETIKRMDLGRMAMALALARLEKGRLTVSSAGMPPLLVHRAHSGEIEEVALSATPLGTLGNEYPEAVIELRERDTVLFMSDGFPELMNDSAQQLGYVAASEAFAAAASGASAQDVVVSLVEHARRWHGDTAPNDDVTFLVVRG